MTKRANESTAYTPASSPELVTGGKSHAPFHWKNLVAGVFVAAVFVALAVRQHLFIDRYAVNILFWDQWDFYAPFFNNGSLWDIFNQQHGPHRQGVGFLLTRLLAEMSHWNTRWDAFGVGYVLLAASLVGIALARKCGARGIALAAIPLIFLNLRQYEMFVNASNISHGAMPMLLLMALMLSFYIERAAWRLSCITALTSLALFTGFGIFAAAIVPTVLIVQLVQYTMKRDKPRAFGVLAALLAIAGAWALFSHGYKFDPAVNGYRFPYEKPWEYFYFVAAMLNNFHGFKTDTQPMLALGLACEIALFALAAFHGWRMVRRGVLEERSSTVIFSLSSFALLYSLNTAIGRVFLGWQDAAAASRYVTLVIPAGFALYLHCATLKTPVLRTALAIAYACFLAYHTVELHSRDWKVVQTYSDGKRAWKAAYLETHSEERANDITHFQIYPAPALGKRLEYLESRKLNLFAPEAKH